MVPKVLRGQRWKTLKRVKLFTPHKLTFKNGKQIVVDDAELNRIKEEMNRVAETGTLATGSQDHILTVTDEGEVRSKPSKDINLFGYFHNYDVVRGKDKQPWIVADFYCDPEKQKTAAEHPFISVEYHPHQHRFSNVAFTKLKPQLDVGVITPYHWERGEIQHSGEASSRLAAYSVEGMTGGVVVYSSERSTMPTELEMVLDAIKEGFASLKGSGAVPANPPAAPAVVTVQPAAPAALSYAALATSGAVATPTSTERELRQLKRKMRLEELSKVKKLHVDTELAEWADSPDAIFDRHCNSIAACYASVSSGGATVTPLDHPTGGRPTPERIAQVQKNIAARGEFANYDSVAARLLADPTWDGTR